MDDGALSLRLPPHEAWDRRACLVRPEERRLPARTLAQVAPLGDGKRKRTRVSKLRVKTSSENRLPAKSARLLRKAPSPTGAAAPTRGIATGGEEGGGGDCQQKRPADV